MRYLDVAVDLILADRRPAERYAWTAATTVAVLDWWVYDNFWHTNNVGNSPGAMEFAYDLAWKPGEIKPAEAADLAEAMGAEPVVCINPAAPESPLFLERLYRP